MIPRRPIIADPSSHSSPDLPPPRHSARVTPDQIEGPEKNTLDSRLSYFRKTLPWFGFFQSSTYTSLYLISLTLFLMGFMAVLLNLEIYNEFKSLPDGFALVYAGTPCLFLFLSNVIALLTFSLTAGNNEDRLLSFLMLNDRNSSGVEDNDPHIRYFKTEFSSKISNSRVYILSFALIAVMFKISVHLCRLSPHTNSFFCVCLIIFWCYLCSVFVVANGLIYMAILSCKVHVSVYKDFLKESVNNVRTLFKHHQRLRKLVERFSEKFSWYLASQAVMCSMSFIFTSMIMYDAYVYRPGLFMLGAADFMCLIVVEIPLFWGILFGLNDLRLQLESICKDVDERGELCQLVSNHPDVAGKWETLALYMEYNSGGVRIFYRKVDSSLVLMFGLQFALVILQLGIAINY